MGADDDGQYSPSESVQLVAVDNGVCEDYRLSMKLNKKYVLVLDFVAKFRCCVFFGCCKVMDFVANV